VQHSSAVAQCGTQGGTCMQNARPRSMRTHHSPKGKSPWATVYYSFRVDMKRPGRFNGLRQFLPKFEAARGRKRGAEMECALRARKAAPSKMGTAPRQALGALSEIEERPKVEGPALSRPDSELRRAQAARPPIDRLLEGPPPCGPSRKSPVTACHAEASAKAGAPPSSKIVAGRD
jgi:hypothetical protein